MKKYLLKFLILAILGFCSFEQAYSQKEAIDTAFHPYYVNYWISVPIIAVGALTNYLGIPLTLNKEDLTLAEVQSVNKDLINYIDKWSLNQNAAQRTASEDNSDYTLYAGVSLPLILLFDKNIRKDWGDVLIMYFETMSITPNIYEWSFLGPAFHNKLRPIVYYDELTYDERKSGNNRNSFYSGHVASVAASSFFIVKVFSDYNPQIGDNKYFLYGAATIPPLLLGYFRIKALKHFPSDVLVGIGVGALFGILVPEMHRLNDKNINLGLYSSFNEVGIAIKWQPDFLK